MSRAFRIDGVEYEIEALTDEGRLLVERMTFAQSSLQELQNNLALLTKAKNAYIADLKLEIVKGRTGVDLAALFDDE